MISAFSQKFGDLEERLELHEKVLKKLNTDFAVNRRSPEPDEIHPAVPNLLLCFQGELKEQTFAVNALQSKVQRQEKELTKLKNDIRELAQLVQGHLQRPRSGAESETSNPTQIKSTLNPEVEEFKPRLSPTIPDSARSKTPPEESPDNTVLEAVEDLLSKKALATWSLGQVVLSGPVEEDARLVGTADDLVIPPARPNSLTTSPRGETPEDAACWDAELGHLAAAGENNLAGNESSTTPNGDGSEATGETVEKRIQDLQYQVMEKDRLIQEVLQNNDELLQREQEHLQHQEWCDHKVRLLRQDKRRRGETIGKLLRCVDELRECGRLDLSKATHERAILTTTISTRGMPHEDRIQVAINVTEAERLHQYRPDKNSPRFDTAFESTEKNSDDTDCKHEVAAQSGANTPCDTTGVTQEQLDL